MLSYNRLMIITMIITTVKQAQAPKNFFRRACSDARESITSVAEGAGATGTATGNTIVGCGERKGRESSSWYVATAYS